ncbi:hypothetical protein CGRA01v4_13458 [Colletotrichum graminicola]|nr:hypothetical protein CGRA01v4_13458 [Colletotrichum graminicola]
MRSPRRLLSLDPSNEPWLSVKGSPVCLKESLKMLRQAGKTVTASVTGLLNQHSST